MVHVDELPVPGHITRYLLTNFTRGFSTINCCDGNTSDQDKMRMQNKSGSRSILFTDIRQMWPEAPFIHLQISGYTPLENSHSEKNKKP